MATLAILIYKHLFLNGVGVCWEVYSKPKKHSVSKDFTSICYTGGHSSSNSDLSPGTTCFPLTPRLHNFQLHIRDVTFFIIISWGKVRLSPLGMLATIWPTAPAPDRWWRVWGSQWNENWQGKTKHLKKTCPSVILSITHPTWPNLGTNPSCRGGEAGIWLPKLWYAPLDVTYITII
jgi:hypothetical protein